ncbi:MAG: carboxypeptidase regulatory-like domain-containing protein [Acidobacteriota bacterium]
MKVARKRSAAQSVPGRRLWIAVMVVATVAWLGLGMPAMAQSTFGSIIGTVKDPAGRVIGGATVRLTNTGTGTSQTARTGGQGSYSFLNLEPAHYSLSVEAKGFVAQTFTDVLLQARQVVRVDANLKVGSETTMVTVRGTSAGAINTDQSSIAATKTGQSLVDLPVAIYSRSTGSTSAYSTLTTQPGVQTDESNNLVIAGSTPALQSYTLDGISTMNVEYGGPSTELFPSFNSIAEIRVGESNNDAEYGGVTDVTTISRSGTNVFHGGLFDNEENTAFNAGDPFALSKPSIHMHNFGGYFGGPLSIPHLYNGHNRTFFFTSYEGLRLPKQQPILVSVPSVAMRQGDLCSYLNAQGVSQVYQPDGTPIPCNSVPIAATSANALTTLFPSPNFGSADSYQNNYQENVSTPISSDQGDLRIDHYFTGNQNMFVRYSYKAMGSSQSPLSVGSPVLGTVETPQTLSNLTGAYNWVIRPTLVNELRAGYSSTDNRTNFNANAATLVQQIGIQGLAQIPTFAAAPNFAINGFVSTGGGNASEQKNKSIEFIDNLSWNRGRHNMKFGVQFNRLRYQDDNVFGGSEVGAYSYDMSSPVGQQIGDPYTAFLLGYPDIVSLAQVSDPGMVGIGHSYIFYAQDEWKATNNLTINWGMRYELHPPLSAQNHNTAAFMPDYSSVVNGQVINGAVVVPDQKGLALTEPGFAQSITPTPILTARQAGIPSTLRYTNKTDWGPRIGFAWRPFGNDQTVLRGGYGRYVAIPLGFSSYTGWAVNTSYFANYPNAYNSNGQPELAFPSPFPSNLFVPGLANFYDVFPLHYIDPTVQEWNLTVERTVGRDIGLRFTYMGNHGTHLDSQEDLNQVPPNTVGYNAVAAQRPYTAWGVLDCVCNYAESNYNSFTADASKRLSGGLQFDVSYVFTRDLSNAEGGNPGNIVGVGGAMSTDRFHPGIDYGNVSYDRRHRFLGTFIYNLPFGAGQRFKLPSRAADNLLGSWQLGGVLLFQTGPFLTPYEGTTDPAGTNILSLLGVTRTDIDRTVSPYASGNVGGLPVSLNVNAFPIPGNNIGRYGNAPVGSVTGPGTQSVSLSLLKSFVIREGAQLHLGLEAANALNHRNYDIPNVQVDSGAFGQISGLQYAEGAGPRMLMLTGRFTF